MSSHWSSSMTAEAVEIQSDSHNTEKKFVIILYILSSFYVYVYVLHIRKKENL